MVAMVEIKNVRAGPIARQIVLFRCVCSRPEHFLIVSFGRFDPFGLVTAGFVI